MDTKGVSCPDCGGTEFTVSDVADNFQYGSGADAVQLAAVLPVHACNSCGFQFTDCDAEVIRHEAVCRHLGRMPPSKILELRKSLKLSREDFARITGIGTASLARWESGHLIQGVAHDNLLYLLLNEENLNRLAARKPEPEYDLVANVPTLEVKSTFVHIETPNEKMLLRKENFSLHLH